jgi:fatty-acyl-CoA synthase
MKASENIVVTPSAYEYPLLIKQLLHTALAIAPDQEIVYADKVRLTYRDFHARLQALARTVERLGLEGETIAVMDWDSHRYLEAFFAVPMTGSVLQTVNVRLSPDQILYTLNHAKARALFVNAEFLPVLEAIRDKLETVRNFVLLADAPTAVPSGFAGEYEALLAANAGPFDFPDFDERTRATTFYTTGTTGLPKGVYFSHRQLVLHTLSLLGLCGIAPGQGSFSRDDVYMPLTPMFHVHAWGFPYAATMAGIKQVYPGRYVPDTILGLIAKEKVTFSHCVPTIMHMLLTNPAAANADLEGWKVIIGGSALPTAMVRTALARGIDIFTGYGMSETCPILSIAHIETADLAGDTVALRTKTGRPNLLVDLRVVTPEMTDCPHDGKTVGEVVVRAPWNTQGYLDNPVASESLWQGGWLHTQDIGHIDERGYLQVTDRIKDVIKTGGEWVSSLEIEDIIGRHAAVSEVAVVGVKDDKWGERPLALIVLKPGQADKVSAGDIQAHVRQYAEQGHISKYGVPDQVRFVDSLARTSVGKLNKRAMREQFSQ